MCALQVNQIVPAYNCGQEEFYQVALLGWDSYAEHQLVFASKNTKYTVGYGTTNRNAVLAAKALSDEQQRNSKTTEELIRLKQKAEAGLVIWKELEGLIISSFAEEFRAAKLEQAGSTHYDGAGAENWEEVSALMESGETFIADNTAALTAGGMPAGFAADFTLKKDEFDDQYGVFKDTEQDSSEQRDAKITANNDADKRLTEMFADGQKYFRLEPAIRERFTFSKVLELVSGAGSRTITLNIAAGGFESVSGVIANSAIVNTGTVAVLVCSGTAACDPLTATRIEPNDQATNTFGSVISVTNTDGVVSASCMVRVVS